MTDESNPEINPEAAAQAAEAAAHGQGPDTEVVPSEPVEVDPATGEPVPFVTDAQLDPDSEKAAASIAAVMTAAADRAAEVNEITEGWTEEDYRLLEVVKSLSDPQNADLWTTEGLLRMDAIETTFGSEDITREDVEKVAPELDLAGILAGDVPVTFWGVVNPHTAKPTIVDEVPPAGPELEDVVAPSPKQLGDGTLISPDAGPVSFSFCAEQFYLDEEDANTQMLETVLVNEQRLYRLEKLAAVSGQPLPKG